MLFNTVFFKATGDETGKFLSLCKSNNITVKNFSSHTGYIPVKEYKPAAKLAKRVGVRLRIIKKQGIYFKIRRYKGRKGFVISGVVTVLLLIFLQNFVWTIEINGNEAVTDSQILGSARQHGLKIGTFLPTENLEKIRLSMSGDLPSLSFISLNKLGSRIEIEVAEEVPKPYILDNNTPYNIVAAKTAKIISSEIYSGQKMFKDGDTVSKGDLLVSGIIETDDQKALYRHSLAKIKGETIFEKEFSIPLNQTEKIYSGERKNRYKIVLFGRKIPLFFKNKYNRKFDIASSSKPFGIEKETLIFYDETPITFSEKEALALIEKSIGNYEKEDLQDAEIISRETSAFVRDNILVCKINYHCIEDIVSFVKINTNLNFSLPPNP